MTFPWCALYVQAVVKKAQEAKRRPTVEELGASVTDSTFLNALQKDVSRWIKEIQKVRENQRNLVNSCISTCMYTVWCVHCLIIMLICGSLECLLVRVVDCLGYYMYIHVFCSSSVP